MNKIQITNNKHALVDEADFEYLNQFNWTHIPSKWNNGYATRKSGRKTVYMHREIMGAKKGQQIDHANHDGLDNRRSNLRVVTQHQNNGNLRKPKHNTSGYKGVSLYKNNKTKPWTASIQNMGRKIHLGYFETPIEAAKAYNTAAISQWGEFANLNKIEAT